MSYSELAAEEKEQMKAQRLHQYRMQIYTLEMDALAYRAIGDHTSALKAVEHIADLKKAYAAVEEGVKTTWVQ